MWLSVAKPVSLPTLSGLNHDINILLDLAAIIGVIEWSTCSGCFSKALRAG